MAKKQRLSSGLPTRRAKEKKLKIVIGEVGYRSPYLHSYFRIISKPFGECVFKGKCVFKEKCEQNLIVHRFQTKFTKMRIQKKFTKLKKFMY